MRLRYLKMNEKTDSSELSKLIGMDYKMSRYIELKMTSDEKKINLKINIVIQNNEDNDRRRGIIILILLRSSIKCCIDVHTFGYINIKLVWIYVILTTHIQFPHLYFS